MAGSLRITPGTVWTAKTALNALVPGRTTLTATGWFQFTSYTGQVNSNIFTAFPVSGIEIASTGSNQVKFFLAGTNSLLQYTLPIVLGQPIFWAFTLQAAGTSRIWINGAVVAAASNIGAMPATPTATQIGWQSAGGVDLLLSDYAIWSTTELVQADLLSLRERSKTPLTLSTPATSYWPLQGTAGVNPTTADAGLHDQIGSNHFATITGLSTSAVYSATAITFVPPITVAEAQVTRWGGTIQFIMGSNPAFGTVQRVYPTAVNGIPTVFKNGVQVQLQGAFWSSVKHDHPYVGYHIVGGVLSTDVITWTTPDAWVTASQGNARDESGTAVNYVGSYERGLFGFQDFGPSTTGWETMKLGWNCPSTVNQTHCILKNVAHRLGTPWFNANTSDPVTGYPLTTKSTFLGLVAREVWNSSGYGNGFDTRSWPIPTGIWKIRGNENAPGSPMTVFLSVQVPNTIDNSSNQLTTPTIIPGTIVGGVEVGREFHFTVNYVAGLLPTFNPSINVNLQTPGHGAGPVTFTDIEVYEPGNEPLVGSPEQVCNDNFAAMVSTPGGIHTPVLRFMEATAGYGTASLVYPEDFPQLGGLLGYDVPAVREWPDWTVNEPTYRNNRKIPIYQYRKYDITQSPNVYFPFPAARTVASDNTSCGLFMWKLADLGLGYDWMYHGTGYNAKLMPIEVVCKDNAGNPINHNLQSGQIMTMPAAVDTGVGATNDQGNIGKANANAAIAIWVTGPQTFVFHCGSTLPSTTKMGYVDSHGPYLQQTAGVNSQVESDIWNGGHALMEDIGCIPATLTGTGLWVATTHCLSDSGVTALATRLRDSSPRGTKFYVQYGNEILIPNIQNSWLQAVASIEGFRDATGAIQITRAAVHRMAQVHAIFKTVFGAVGDADSVVRLYQPFVVSPSGTLDGLVYAQEQSIPIDGVATALYIDNDFSPSYKMMAAMVGVNQQFTISGVPTHVSIAHSDNGGPAGVLQTWVNNTPIPMEALHDQYRFHLKYNKANNAGTSGLTIAYNAIVSSGYGGGGGTSGFTYPFPKLMGYECAPSTMIPGGVSTKTNKFRSWLTHDFCYNQAAYDTWYAFYQFSQQPGPAGTVGADLICMEALHGQRQSGGDNHVCPDGNDNPFVECWVNGVFQGQQAGHGSGNKFALSDLNGDGLVHDLDNVSVTLQAAYDWIALTGGGSVVVPANPRKRRWVPRMARRVRA